MTSWLQLAHKTVIVTGAGSGIGAMVVRSLLAQQCRVILVDRDDASLQHITKDASVAQCDVSNEDQVRDVFAQYSYQNPSILINCAGITRDGWISNLSANDDWDSVLDSNLKGTFLMCREFIRLQNARLKQGEARQACSIINIGSVVSEYGNLGQTNYAASKGGVLGLTRALAKETARGDVRVNAVLPGFIDTPMAQQVPMHVQEQIMNKIPMGRFGQPEEVADLILFLASPRSSYITGECIKVSGMISL